MTVVLFSVMMTGIGLTAAIWDSQSGGSSEYGPVLDSNDWNSWRKYFAFDNIEAESAVVGCAVAGYDGTNLGDVIFPPTNNSGIAVTEIRSTVFADATKKELPVALYISGSVTKISPSTFQGLPNLQVVVFASGSAVDVGAFAFAFCQNLQQVVVEGGRTLNLDVNAFRGSINIAEFSGKSPEQIETMTY